MHRARRVQRPPLSRVRQDAIAQALRQPQPGATLRKRQAIRLDLDLQVLVVQALALLTLQARVAQVRTTLVESPAQALRVQVRQAPVQARHLAAAIREAAIRDRTPMAEAADADS